MAKRQKSPITITPRPEQTQDVTVRDANGSVVFQGSQRDVPDQFKNKGFTLRDRYGHIKIFTDPQDLIERCIKYFEWADNNPLYKSEPLKSGALAGTEMDVKVMRPYILKEMCLFIGISSTTWSKYKTELPYVQFREAVQFVEDAIETRKLQGAYIGVYHPLIAARDLGLAEKTESEQNTNINYTVTGIRLKNSGNGGD